MTVIEPRELERLARKTFAPAVAFVHAGCGPFLDREFEAWLRGAATFLAVAVLTLGGARPFTAAAPAIDGVAIELPPAPDPRRRALVSYLSDRYRVEREDTRVFVDEAHAAAAEFDLDPLLVLAVMGVESSFNSAARSGSGAQGLMQVVPRFHPEKLVEHGGEAALADPRVNVLVGARILNEYLRKTGNLHAGLQRYAGSSGDEERRYARKVITERERLRRVVQEALQPGIES